jgi:hypothetical protein
MDRLLPLVVASTFPDYSGLASLLALMVLAGALGLVLLVVNLKAPRPWSRTLGLVLGLCWLAPALLMLAAFADTASGGGLFIMAAFAAGGLAQAAAAVFGHLATARPEGDDSGQGQ